jgi:putative hydrolase of the HAD superfamily
VNGLLVDFGGVLTTNVFESFRAFSEQEGLEPDAVKKLFKERGEGLDLLRQLERGEITGEDFSPRFGALLGVENTDGLTHRLFAKVGPDPEMVEAVKAAKRAGVKTGLISNSWGDRGQYDRDSFPQMFDAVVISGEVGLNKPDPEIFRLGAERVALAPEECVFVDDLQENCDGAEAVGMTAILHRGAEGTLAELERLLGVTLRRPAA